LVNVFVRTGVIVMVSFTILGGKFSTKIVMVSVSVFVNAIVRTGVIVMVSVSGGPMSLPVSAMLMVSVRVLVNVFVRVGVIMMVSVSGGTVT